MAALVVAAAVPTAAPAAGRVLWGATISGPDEAGDPPWNWDAQSAFERASAGGKPASLVHFGAQLRSEGCGGGCPFLTAAFRITRAHGAIPFFSWSTIGLSLKDIAAGSYDEDIRQWSRDAARWGKPFFVRLDWEMNGPWFDWGVGAGGNTAGDYVAMWRHVHDIATSAGATNATWVWCPNVNGGKLASARDVYPGSRYVDWTCLDGYNSNDPWTPFTRLFAASYDEIVKHIAPGKPMLVAETASTEQGGDKGQWIRDMFAALPQRFPRVRGFMWFDRNDPGLFSVSDWTLSSSPAASAAFATGVAAKRYAANRFGSITGHPIRPPR
jgi:hypothetical protein